MPIHHAVVRPARNLGGSEQPGQSFNQHPLDQFYRELARHASGTPMQAAQSLSRTKLWQMFQQAVQAFADRDHLDCLSHTRVTPLAQPLRTRRCIVSIVSPGYENLLDTMLKSVHRFGECGDVLKVVLCVDGDDKCRDVIARNGAKIIECHSLSKIGASMRGALYSIARWVDAEEFLLLDADMLIVGSLRPLFEALPVFERRSIGMVRAGRGWWLPRLEDPSDLLQIIGEDFSGTPEDIAFITGQAELLGFYWYNGGLILARRESLLALDERLRQMEPFGSLWIDERPDIYWREEGLMNIALALNGGGVLLDDVWNLLMFRQGLELKWDKGKLNLLHNESPVRVLHLVGQGKPMYAEMCRLLNL